MEIYGSGSKREVFTNSSRINAKVKEQWATSYSQIGSGFSWPPRSYNCSFCKREFRSAQALGGHMNVHRRDKARLRQSPPLDCPPFNPNPTLGGGKVHVSCSEAIPNLNMSPPSSIAVQEKPFPVAYIFPFMLPARNYLAPLKDEGAQIMTKPVAAMTGIAELKGCYGEDAKSGMMLKGSEVVSLDLDLELRLGYSTV